ncbi:MAG: hypothetical protein QUT30_00410 [Acidobacteriota bacterium]|jgi:hypothetical protein|nr:hypothetical protein [Acidobacteriota bacterium]
MDKRILILCRAVLLSHDPHSGNLDLLGRKLFKEADMALTTPEGAERLKDNGHGLSAWEKMFLQTAGGSRINITATPCRYAPAGIEPITGQVTGFMLEAQHASCGPLYVTGDTVYFEGIAEVARRFSPQWIMAVPRPTRFRTRDK